MRGCDDDRLYEAMSFIPDSMITRVFELATGDREIYDDFSLPKPNRETIIQMVAIAENKPVEEILDITNVEVEDFCNTVKVSYNYQKFNWYKTEGAKASHIDPSDSQYREWKIKGEKTGFGNTYVRFDMDQWLYNTKQLND